MNRNKENVEYIQIIPLYKSYLFNYYMYKL